jgi:hypothetical protein
VSNPAPEPVPGAPEGLPPNSEEPERGRARVARWRFAAAVLLPSVIGVDGALGQGVTPWHMVRDIVSTALLLGLAVLLLERPWGARPRRRAT